MKSLAFFKDPLCIPAGCSLHQYSIDYNHSVYLPLLPKYYRPTVEYKILTFLLPIALVYLHGFLRRCIHRLFPCGDVTRSDLDQSIDGGIVVLFWSDLVTMPKGNMPQGKSLWKQGVTGLLLRFRFTISLVDSLYIT